MTFSAVILAGGKSSRMGRDKAFLEVRGQTLLSRQMSLAREIGAQEIFISGRAGVDYSSFGCSVLGDKFPDAGPLAGIERAFDASPSPLLLVLAVDLPEMNADFLCALANHCTGNRGVVPRVNEDIEPLAAFYPKAALPLATLLLAQNSFAIKNFAQTCEEGSLVSFMDFPHTAHLFRNCNSPSDLECVRRNQAV